MEIKSLKGIEEMRNKIDCIKERITSEDFIDRTLFDIYENYIEKVYNIILEGVDEGELYEEQAAIFDEIVLVRKILYWKYIK